MSWVDFSYGTAPNDSLGHLDRPAAAALVGPPKAKIHEGKVAQLKPECLLKRCESSLCE